MPVTGVEEVHETDSVDPTGTDNVDALLSGVRWSDLDDDGVFEVSFSFGSADSVYGFDEALGYETGDDFNEPTFGMFSLSDDAKEQFYDIVENLESFTNLDMVEVEETDTEAGTVRIVWSEISDESAVGWAYLPGDWWGAGDIWLIDENHDESDVDFFHTMIHELGHALGLKHSFEVEGEFPAIDSQYEGVEYTVMSYTVSARFPDATYADLWPQTYMYWDILALQAMYGVDTVTTAGADTYSFDMDERYLMTIWDYGGEDTLALTSGSENAYIDLTPGSWSNVGTTIEYYDGDFFYDSNTVYIADDTTIENATGASGNDTIIGNDADNKLIGNAGSDVLRGNVGDDVISGGAGNDVLTLGDGDDVGQGGSGNDKVWAGGGDTGDDVMVGDAGNDEMGGGAGNDLLVGGGADDGSTLDVLSYNGNSANDGSDTLYGGDGNDTLIGGGWDDGAVSDNGIYDAGEAVLSGSADDVIWAGTGNDLVLATGGSDALGGGAGDDTIYGGGGNDVIYGGIGETNTTSLNDALFGEAGNDTIYSGAGNDSVGGGGGADDIYTGGGEDTVDGGAGDDTLWGGGGDDEFTGSDGADVFVFGEGHGDDTVTDFNVEDDTLALMYATTDFQSAADVEAASSEVNGGVLIDIGGGDSVFLDGLSLSDLSELNYVF